MVVQDALSMVQDHGIVATTHFFQT